jgi:hypothetical protein
VTKSEPVLAEMIHRNLSLNCIIVNLLFVLVLPHTHTHTLKHVMECRGHTFSPELLVLT